MRKFLNKNNKETLADLAKLEGLTVAGLLKMLIVDYLSIKTWRYRRVKNGVC